MGEHVGDTLYSSSLTVHNSYDLLHIAAKSAQEFIDLICQNSRLGHFSVPLTPKMTKSTIGTVIMMKFPWFIHTLSFFVGL